MILADPEGNEVSGLFSRRERESFQIVIGPEGDLTREEREEILKKLRETDKVK